MRTVSLMIIVILGGLIVFAGFYLAAHPEQTAKLRTKIEAVIRSVRGDESSSAPSSTAAQGAPAAVPQQQPTADTPPQTPAPPPDAFQHNIKRAFAIEQFAKRTGAYRRSTNIPFIVSDYPAEMNALEANPYAFKGQAFLFDAQFARMTNEHTAMFVTLRYRQLLVFENVPSTKFTTPGMEAIVAGTVTGATLVQGNNLPTVRYIDLIICQRLLCDELGD